MTATNDRRATVTTPSDTRILITREFDAPRELVYRAFTTPELLRRWWHANRAEVTGIEMDVRVGGAWRWAAKAFNGYEFAFYGEYQEVVPDERLVTTETFSGAPDAQALTTTTFTEKDGLTYLEILVEHQTKANRDMQLQSGMEDGLDDALTLLEQLAHEQA
ncbi:SRPBCC family protein [Streptacidiphilus sp. N1-12]|uniref:SRPBCC family protein n=2 Tax=Streptacidiphilus alkalitolerans TaxID=3342712 RepID=A0ABV6VHD9_9ACTN